MEIGHYEKKQLFCQNRIIAWSHGSRFELARKLVKQFAGKKLLDYGCGDGTFLKEIYDIFPDAVGADLAEDQILDCQRRFHSQPSLRFITNQVLHRQYMHEQFDVITCMEVLEHCVGDVVNNVLDDLAKLVSSNGVIIISVPVEIGPSLVIKQTLRKLAGLRNLGDYKWTEKYSMRELSKMLFASSSTTVERPIHSGLSPSHGHKGFNWRALEKRIQNRFLINNKLFTPLGSLGGYFSSQVWFICSLKQSTLTTCKPSIR